MKSIPTWRGAAAIIALAASGGGTQGLRAGESSEAKAPVTDGGTPEMRAAAQPAFADLAAGQFRQLTGEPADVAAAAEALGAPIDAFETVAPTGGFQVGRRARILESEDQIALQAMGFGALSAQGVGFLEGVPDQLLPVAVPPIGAPSWLEGFRLRNSWDPVKLFQLGDDGWFEDESAIDSDGAEFGWTRNELTGATNWNAKGVAYYPMLFNSSRRAQYVLTPSVEFNRDTATDGTDDEVNSLIGRLGLDLNFVDTSSRFAKGFVARGAIGYQTDFDFDSEHWFFEMQPIEWVDSEWGIGVFRSISGPSGEARTGGVRHKVTLAPILAVGAIEDAGKKIKLSELEDTYATVGFKSGLDLELNFLPQPFNLTKAGVEYRWWNTFGGDSESYDYFDAHLTLPISRTRDRLALKAFYRKGNNPTTLEETDLIGVGLTAKF